jgi:acetoin utilization deacetylase AcuC-like enzyme
MVPLLIATASAPDHYFQNHAECPDRIEAISKALKDDAELHKNLEYLKDADIPHIAEEDLESIHTLEYLNNLCQSIPPPDSPHPSIALRDPDDPDGPTYATPTSYNDALHAASAAVALVKSNQSGISFCRPPGHHATSNEYMGFCLLNSVALAARYAQRTLGIHKVAIIDFDVHTGNGTSEIFYHDSSVLFIDIHKEGVWPGTGSLEETGSCDGQGFTINIPLPDGSGHSAAMAAMAEVVVPALRRFQPQLILLSAGFDAHYKDPLESLNYQSETYHSIVTSVLHVAKECTGYSKIEDSNEGAKVVAVLEGGYNQEVLGEAAVEMARAFVGLPPKTEIVSPDKMPQPEPTKHEVEAVLQRVKQIHRLV